METISRRIKDEDYDLQPDFQRGDVWPRKKQQRLIDTILRGWHIPPVHLVVREGGTSDVLDGQQRLTAIRDFMQGTFVVDGAIEPRIPSIESLDGLRFEKLPAEVRRRFLKFTIRVFELTDYAADEPHELFFRLNQPTNLTEAEKRNAFIGGPRNQIKQLVDDFSVRGLDKERLGFSNARMAYDDLLGRFLLTVENKTLLEKITAGRITERYREPEAFGNQTMDSAERSLSFLLGASIWEADDRDFKPNKATIHTWLCLAARIDIASMPVDQLRSFESGIAWIENHRWKRDILDQPDVSAAIRIFHDRSTSRVADVSSVVLRDLIAFYILVEGGFLPTKPSYAETLEQMRHQLSNLASGDKPLWTFAADIQWGAQWEL